MKRIFSSIIIVALTSVFIFGQDEIKSLEEQLKTNSQNVEILVKLGIAYHNKGVNGDKKAVKSAEEHLNKALELDRTNALALAYLGSVWTLKGRDAFFPWNKMKNVEKGMDKIDKAVDMSPDNLRVRMLRAMNSLNLPPFFHRLQYSLKDFTYITDNPEFKNWPTESQSMVYYNLGLAFEKDEKPNEAKNNFELAIQTAPESKWAKNAKEELKLFSTSK
jgi:tetratricopeptide (TPR) repeat protein